MADEDSHTTDSNVSGDEGHSDPLSVAAEARARLQRKRIVNKFS